MEDYSCRPMSHQIIAPCVFLSLLFGLSVLFLCLQCFSPVPCLDLPVMFYLCSQPGTLCYTDLYLVEFSFFVLGLLLFCSQTLDACIWYYCTIVFSPPALVNLIWILFLQKCDIHMLKQ